MRIVLFLLLFAVAAVLATVSAQRNGEPDPNDFIMVDEEAKPVNMEEIRTCVHYPDSARNAGITGKVVLRVLVNKKGEYVRHIRARDPHRWLTEEVERCIARLRYTPAVQNGQAVAMWVNVPFNFTLNIAPPAITPATPSRPK